MNLMRWSCLAFVCGGVAVLGCRGKSGADRRPGGSTAPGSADSPRALLETVHKLTQAGAAADAIACMDPAVQDPVRRMLDARSRLIARASSAAAAVEKKFGRDKADQFREIARSAGAGEKLPSPLADAVVDGQVDWGRVKIVIDETNPDRAVVSVAGAKQALGLVRVAGRWYVAGPAGQSAARQAEQADAVTRDLDALAAAVEEFEKKVKDGTVTRETFDAEFARVGAAVNFE